VLERSRPIRDDGGQAGQVGGTRDHTDNLSHTSDSHGPRIQDHGPAPMTERQAEQVWLKSPGRQHDYVCDKSGILKLCGSLVRPEAVARLIKQCTRKELEWEGVGTSDADGEMRDGAVWCCPPTRTLSHRREVRRTVEGGPKW
jgi:hypothetical protein